MDQRKARWVVTIAAVVLLLLELPGAQAGTVLSASEMAAATGEAPPKGGCPSGQDCVSLTDCAPDLGAQPVECRRIYYATKVIPNCDPTIYRNGCDTGTWINHYKRSHGPATKVDNVWMCNSGCPTFLDQVPCPQTEHCVDKP
jgi:hypothetical protein